MAHSICKICETNEKQWKLTKTRHAKQLNNIRNRRRRNRVYPYTSKILLKHVLRGGPCFCICFIYCVGKALLSAVRVVGVSSGGNLGGTNVV